MKNEARSMKQEARDRLINNGMAVRGRKRKEYSLASCFMPLASRYLPLAFVVCFLLAMTGTVKAQGTDSLVRQTDSLLVKRLQTAPPPRKIGVVLCGGGAKGVAHIGVLKVLERAGIPVHVITGTSMGSLVGGIYACGHKAAELDSIVRAQNWAFTLSDRDDPQKLSLRQREKQSTYFLTKTFSSRKGDGASSGGFIAGKNIQPLLDTYTEPYHDSIDFNRLPIPFACVATNLVDYSEYVFHSGVLSRAMRASMAIPGVFSPVRTGGMVLVDGGLRNNFPVDVAREMGADFIIGVDVQEAEKSADELNSTMSILMQLLGHNCKNKYEENLRLTDLHIHIDTKGYTAASFSTAAIDTLIRRGEEEAMKHWDQLVALRKCLGIPAVRSMEQQPAPVDKPSSALAVITNPSISMGVRFDSEEMVALQANAELPLRTKLPADLELTVRLGKRLMARADFSVHPVSFFQPTVSYTFRNNDMDFYENGGKACSMTYNQHGVQLSLFNFDIRNFHVSIGADWNYYDYHSQLFNHHPKHMPDTEQDDAGYVNYELQVEYDSEDDAYLPTRGARLHGRYAYYTDNFVTLDGKAGMREYMLMGRFNFPLGARFSLQPMAYFRSVYGHEVPFVLSNVMGGEWFGHYLEQQLPFAGVGNMELAWDRLAVAQLQAQYRLTLNSAVLMRVSVGQNAPTVKELPEYKTKIGASLSYYMNTMFGPLGGSIGYSNITKKFYYYINLGFVF